MHDQESWWVLRAQAGDREALEALLKRLQEPLGRYLLRLLGNSVQAEDALQETLVRIWRKLYWLRDPALLRPWAYRIASREAFTQLKRERRWREQLRDDVLLESLPEPPATLTEPLTALNHISPASRAVLLLHYEQELSLEEIAEVLELPLGTVKSRLAYGLKQLRKEKEHES